MTNDNLPRAAADGLSSLPITKPWRGGAATVFGLLAMVFMNDAIADGMRCGTRVISEGDHAARVLRYCGEPDYAHSRRAHVPFFNNAAGTTFFPPGLEEIWIEEWTYNRGPHKLMRLVTIENGRVIDIEHLGYGYSN